MHETTLQDMVSGWIGITQIYHDGYGGSVQLVVDGKVWHFGQRGGPHVTAEGARSENVLALFADLAGGVVAL
jgi:hypothetical protein